MTLLEEQERQSMVQRVQGNAASVLQYENPMDQCMALSVTPVDELEVSSPATPAAPL